MTKANTQRRAGTSRAHIASKSGHNRSTSAAGPSSPVSSPSSAASSSSASASPSSSRPSSPPPRPPPLAAAAASEQQQRNDIPPIAATALGPFVQPGESLEQWQPRFWRHQLAVTEGQSSLQHTPLEVAAEATNTKPEDVVTELKLGTGQIPLARIKKVIKGEGDETKMISAELPQIFARACEVFIADLTARAFQVAESHRRRTIQRSDVCEAAASDEAFDFLIDTVPEALLSKARRRMRSGGDGEGGGGFGGGDDGGSGSADGDTDDEEDADGGGDMGQRLGDAEERLTSQDQGK